MVRADTQSKKITAILAKADSAYGEYLSGQCVTCHHAKGKADGIPAIVGLPDVYIVQTILEYKHAREERTNRNANRQLFLNNVHQNCPHVTAT